MSVRSHRQFLSFAFSSAVRVMISLFFAHLVIFFFLLGTGHYRYILQQLWVLAPLLWGSLLVFICICLVTGWIILVEAI